MTGRLAILSVIDFHVIRAPPGGQGNRHGLAAVDADRIDHADKSFFSACAAVGRQVVQCPGQDAVASLSRIGDPNGRHLLGPRAGRMGVQGDNPAIVDVGIA